MTVPARKPALSLTKAPVREHPVAPIERVVEERRPDGGSSRGGTPTDSGPDGDTAKTPAPPAPRGMGTLTVRIDLDLRHDIKRHALDQNTTVQTVIGAALREYLTNHARPQAQKETLSVTEV